MNIQGRHEDGIIRTSGSDWGRPSIYPEVLHQAGIYFVLRVKGCEQWSRVGETKYYPTTYYLAERFVPDPPFGGGQWPDSYVALRTIESQEPGRSWRRCLRKLKERADELHSRKDMWKKQQEEA